ncbi:cation diffusion facilitator family transporter, partial [Desulfosarcina sp.]|uniref:cation diffusion facilitator family transporter n=1 Tax=Desulfosarcina sp. TaxID=2027861 RepID=UPI0035641B53
TVFNTFGYRRAEIMAALINVMLLAGASGVILYHAVQRFLHPQTVNGLIVIVLAGVGVVGNGLSAWLLHRDAAHSLNVRGAFLHMVGDLLTSVAVLINGLLLLYYPWYWLDPLLSVLIVIIILKNGWNLFKESTAVLMNATPGHLRLEKVRDYLCHLPGILNVHYLHAWQVSSSSTAFSCHVVVPDQPVSRTGQLSERIKHELLHRFRIDHPVLQFETGDCGQGTLLCEMACNGAIGGSISKTRDGADSVPAKNRQRIQPLLFHALRLLLGAVFLYASYDKILHPEAFAQAVYNYQILPDGLINLAALVLPWLELLLGLCLVAGVWLPGTTVLSTTLLAVFIGALVFNQIRGLDVHCGCFSTETTEGPADLWTVARDVSFLVVSAYLTVKTFLSNRSAP